MMQTLKTTNQSLQSDNVLLSTSLQEMKETNTMLTAQLNEKICRIMELERELSTMSQMYPLELSSQTSHSLYSDVCSSFRPSSVLAVNKFGGIVKDRSSSPSIMNGYDCHL